MKTYTKYIINIFLNSLVFVFLIITSLVFILNLLSEIEFFKNEDVSINLSIFLSFLNSPSLIFELFPFIILLAIQLFFIKIFEHKEIEVMKYFGLKNTKIITILISTSFILGVLIITLFYSFSSSLKNFYLELKSNYANDGKYLAVINNNGLWIKDTIDNKIIITNSSYIENNYLVENFITIFDKEFNILENIRSKKIDISQNNWKIYNARIYKMNNYVDEDQILLSTSFNVNRIKTLYSNLSALNLLELFKIRDNYKKLKYSITEVDIHILKIISYPIYLLLMALFSSILMLNTKKLSNTTFKIFIGIFFSVIVYYVNNFSYVLGAVEKVPVYLSVFIPLLVLFSINIIMLNKVNSK